MKRILLLVLAVSVVACFSGCETESGSREYIPGKGWVPND
jgi:hypothetical protein